MDVQIKRVDGNNPDLQNLAAALSAQLAELNGEKNDFYAQFNKAASLPHAVVAYKDDKPVGCGGFRPFEDAVVEIKRMFVTPDCRGMGVGRLVLSELEAWAAQLDYRGAVLETSKRLTAANKLYLSAGYELIPNYDPYVGIEDSVCMRKSLS